MRATKAKPPTRPRRTKPCRVCSLPATELDLLDAGLSFGWSARSLAARFGTVTRKDITAHTRKYGKEEE